MRLRILVLCEMSGRKSQFSSGDPAGKRGEFRQWAEELNGFEIARVVNQHLRS